MGPRRTRVGARRIVCLACGEIRVAFGIETFECPRCGYLGWASVDDVDTTTLRLIMNGALAHRRARAPFRAA